MKFRVSLTAVILAVSLLLGLVCCQRSGPADETEPTALPATEATETESGTSETNPETKPNAPDTAEIPLSTDLPETAVPVTDPLVTLTEITDPPMTEPPAISAPVTSAPSTTASVTTAPQTTASVTTPTTTAAPVTTPPETQAPETQPPVETAAYTVPKAANGITLDGDINDTEWAGALAFDMYARHGDGLTNEMSCFKLMWDENFLYVGYCGPWIDQLWNSKDWGGYVSGENFTLYITDSPTTAYSDYTNHVSASPNVTEKVNASCLSVLNKPNLMSYHKDTGSGVWYPDNAAQVNNLWDTYTLEVKIPFKEINLDRSKTTAKFGDTIYMTINVYWAGQLLAVTDGTATFKLGKAPAAVTRMDRSKLNIGAYCVGSFAENNENYIRDIARCQLDFMLVVNDESRDILDNMRKYGIGAVTLGSMPSYRVDTLTSRGLKYGQWNVAASPDVYEKQAKIQMLKDHPAIWAYDAGDEPNALDFRAIGAGLDRVKSLFPDTLAFLCLFPNYATASGNGVSARDSMLGTQTYREYIEQYCRYIDLDYICYDHYFYTKNTKISAVENALENLRVVSEACDRNGKDLWITLQANTLDSDSYWISTNQLRYQAYSAMAYGAKSVLWACYTAGWGYNNVIDDHGNKTQQYDKLKTVNTEIHTIGAAFMNYRHVGTTLVGYEGTSWLSSLSSQSSFSNDLFQNVKDENGKPLIIGEMASDNGGALMICASDDPLDQGGTTYQITFSVPAGKTVRAIGGNGDIAVESWGNHVYCVRILSNDGVLITVE